ncbi:hypothetical protein WOLCODRAFT_153155 [Wolfiporia cocos MD-104 SS10]|uniref:Uncharacterized protein n=1 Tax=Wolfiporia cocos (strain MD-104) TaxID=742152 RepID=A0A2H3JLL4_WOLCO|nr:hypothetical protein WOLCODRAFT_153155 [Wolfiporia cocos MD-104 SS10]
MSLLGAGLYRIKSYFTSSLNKWADGLDAWDNEDGVHSRKLISIRLADSITAVDLARLTQSYSILPTALYLRSVLPLKVLVEGVENPDGTREMLSRENLWRYLAVREAVLRRCIASDFAISSSAVSAECNQCAKCVQSFRAIRAVASTNLKIGITTWNGLASEYKYTSIRTPQSFNLSNLCTACKEHLEWKVAGEKPKTWDKLRQMMGLIDSKHPSTWDSSKWGYLYDIE